MQKYQTIAMLLAPEHMRKMCFNLWICQFIYLVVGNGNKIAQLLLVEAVNKKNEGNMSKQMLAFATG